MSCILSATMVEEWLTASPTRATRPSTNVGRSFTILTAHLLHLSGACCELLAGFCATHGMSTAVEMYHHHGFRVRLPSRELL